MIVALLVAAALLVVVVVVVLASRRRPADGVVSFQRQIDALSPEARRRVVDRVQQLDADGAGPAADGDAGRPPADRGQEPPRGS
jgi:hypothetical protein